MHSMFFQCEDKQFLFSAVIPFFYIFYFTMQSHEYIIDIANRLAVSVGFLVIGEWEFRWRIASTVSSDFQVDVKQVRATKKIYNRRLSIACYKALKQHVIASNNVVIMKVAPPPEWSGQ